MTFWHSWVVTWENALSTRTQVSVRRPLTTSWAFILLKRRLAFEKIVSIGFPSKNIEWSWKLTRVVGHVENDLDVSLLTERLDDLGVVNSQVVHKKGDLPLASLLEEQSQPLDELLLVDWLRKVLPVYETLFVGDGSDSGSCFNVELVKVNIDILAFWAKLKSTVSLPRPHYLIEKDYVSAISLSFFELIMN